MRSRHRIPSVFNLSMVDVLCCALGCVILLWLINSRAARDRAREEGSTRTRLKKLESQHAATRASLRREKQEKRRLASQLAALKALHASTETSLVLRLMEQRRLEEELAGLKKKNASARAGLDRLHLDAQALQARYDAGQAVLARQKKDQRDLTAQLAGLKALHASTVARLTARSAEKRKLEAAIDDLKAKNTEAEASVVKLTREQRALLKELAALKSTRIEDREDLRKKTLELRGLEKVLASLRTGKADVEKRLEESEARALALEIDVSERNQKLAAAKARSDDLKRDKKRLADQVVRVRAAADNRFAGISLTGARVVFLVDMSGSMELVDEKTGAPEKWAGVRQTVARLMRSLPDLKKFQVILFSNKVTYLFGTSDRWIDYQGSATVRRVTRALARIKPDGGTNMSASFAAAFRFRPAGLDTIYVLSDGLPNHGEGLTRQQARKLKERERSEILSRYIRSKLKTSWNPPLSGRRVCINTIGFFYESPDVGAFLWALARENDGSFVGMSKP